jgi:hypothetical protein
MQSRLGLDKRSCSAVRAAFSGGRRFALGLVVVLALPFSGFSQSTVQLNQNCTVSILNRNMMVGADGSWLLPNVPANLGLVRARATCVQNGATVSGQSDLFTLPANGVVNLPNIQLGSTTPIPNSLAVTAPSVTLTSAGQTVQLSVIATMSNGTTQDVTAATAGTQYRTSNPALATVSTDGLVTAVQAGTVLVQATNEGTQGMLLLHVVFGATTPSGIPYAWAIANGLDPNDPNLANEDPDHDGLTNLQEYQLGTGPNNPDTDGDGISDGDEVMIYHTNPLLADTDGDGIPDGVEIQTGSDPLDPKSYNLALAVATLEVKPPTFTLTVNSLSGTASVQLQVLGHLIDGKTTSDLTSIARWGTNYASSDLTVCNFGAPDGTVFAGNSGSCTVTVTIPGHSITVAGTVVGFTPQALSSVSIPGYANHVEISGNYAYVAAGSAGLQVVDISDRKNPQVVAALALAGNADGLKVVGQYAYVAAGTAGLQIVDISAPLAPVLKSSFSTGDEVWDLRVSGGMAYVANGNSGIMAINVSNPAAPAALGSLALSGFTKGVALDTSRNLMVAVGSAGLFTIDVTTPGSPALLGSLNWYGDARAVAVQGNFAFVADVQTGLTSVDLTNPAAPVLGTSAALTLGGRLRDLAVVGNLELGADVYFGTGVPVVDVSAPPALTPLQTLIFSQNRTPYVAGTGIAADAVYLYLTASDDWETEKGAAGNTLLYIGQFAPFPQDTNGIPPTASIIAPSNGADVIAGSQLSITVNAADDVAVAALNVLVNSQVVFSQAVLTGSCAPCQFAYAVPVGATSLTIGAQAVDFGDNVGTAQPVTVTVVPDTIPPTVSIAAPFNGGTVYQGASLPIRVGATDNVSVSQVTILVNGQPVFTTSSSPYQFVYNVPLNATSLTIGAQAVDPSGNVGTAQTVTITAVPNLTPPAVTILAPVNGSQVFQGAILPISLSATDNVAVSQVTVSINGQPTFASSTSPYQFSYSIPPGANTLVIGAQAVDPSGNVGAAQPVTVAVLQGLVAILSPTDGGTVPQGTQLPISVVASDSVTVDVLVNGQMVVQGAFSPIEYALTGPFVAPTLTVAARATPYQSGPEDKPGVLAKTAVRALPNLSTDGSGQVSTAQATVTVVPGPLTAAQGLVVVLGNAPYGGATVVCQGKTAVSGADGSFSIADLDSAAGPLTCIATATIGGVANTAFSAAIASSPGGATNVGTMTLAPRHSKGKEFWLVNAGFQVQPYPGALILVSDTTANFTVSNVSLNFTATGTVTPGSPATVTLPKNLATGIDGPALENMGIHVTSDADISVFLAIVDDFRGNTGTLLGIPVTALGTEYSVLSYPGSPGVLAVVASRDGTHVTISNACSFSDTVALDQGQTYNLQCLDVSGAHVVSDQPVGVVSGDPGRVSIPNTGYSPGYLSAMLFPLGVAWGTDLYGPPTTLQNSYVYRVTAAADATVVTADLGGGNTQTMQLDHGELQEFDFTGTNFTGVHFSSNLPIQVMHYGADDADGSSTPQPFQMPLIPVASFGTSFYFYSLPASSLGLTATNTALIVVPNSAVGSVQLNGSAVVASSFNPLPGGAYQFAQVAVPDGINVVTSTQPAMVYTLGTTSWMNGGGGYYYQAFGSAYGAPVGF